jgi:hypothetical protein
MASTFVFTEINITRKITTNHAYPPLKQLQTSTLGSADRYKQTAICYLLLENSFDDVDNCCKTTR